MPHCVSLCCSAAQQSEAAVRARPLSATPEERSPCVMQQVLITRLTHRNARMLTPVPQLFLFDWMNAGLLQ